MKKVLLMATAGLVCLIAGSSLVYADDAKDSDFIGEYIGDMPEVDKYANPDVMKLYFNDDGNLERYRRKSGYLCSRCWNRWNTYRCW